MSGAGDNGAQPPSGKAFRGHASHGAEPSRKELTVGPNYHRRRNKIISAGRNSLLCKSRQAPP